MVLRDARQAFRNTKEALKYGPHIRRRVSVNRRPSFLGPLKVTETQDPRLLLTGAVSLPGGAGNLSFFGGIHSGLCDFLGIEKDRSILAVWDDLRQIPFNPHLSNGPGR